MNTPDIKQIKGNRFDLSDYLIHFTRKDQKSSFETLKDIISSGRLNCGWSRRSGKNTIFGNTPAICFTEMPLYSFYQYVENRANIEKVDFYGIALHKKKMFNLGARNVIYGTTSDFEVENKLTNGSWENPNLPPNEQYRYMLTGINDINDWTHEREWRWANVLNKSKGNYLPIWHIDVYDEDFGDFNFFQENHIYIITRTENEIDELEKLFKSFTNTKIYNSYNINKTFAISLENIKLYDLLSYEKLTFNLLFQHNACRKLA